VQWKSPSCKSPVFTEKQTPFVRDTIVDPAKHLRVGAPGPNRFRACDRNPHSTSADPAERDEGEYAYASQLILQNTPPSKLAYNMKFPGTYAAYTVINDSGWTLGPGSCRRFPIFWTSGTTAPKIAQNCFGSAE